jgi:hypothetical protein
MITYREIKGMWTEKTDITYGTMGMSHKPEKPAGAGFSGMINMDAFPSPSGKRKSARPWT